MFVSGFPSLLLSSRPLPLRARTTASWGCSPSSRRWSTIPERGPAHRASAAAAAAAALAFPLQHTASSLYTCQPRPSRPCFPSSLALGTFCLDAEQKEKPVRWSAAGTLPGKKRGPVVLRRRGLRVFRRSGSAVGAPLSQTSERAPSGRSGGGIYITHADAGKH